MKSSAAMTLQFAILILILSLITLTCSQSGFTLFPTPQVVPSEAHEAIFYCRHPSARSIGWRVDGNLLGRMPLMGVTPCTDPRLDGVVIDRLKVEVDPDYTYNGIVVQCVAYFIGRPVEASESANLTIQADAAFQMGFVITPYSQYQNSAEIVLAAGVEGVFECQYCIAEDISWTINGEILDELSLHAGNTTTIVRYYTVRPYCGPLHMLRISNTSNYNSSTIQCGPEVGSSNEISEVVTLWIQGATLNPIQSIRKIAYDTYSVYEWNVPFSLDLTGIDPDIVYCVTVYEIICLNQNNVLRLKDDNCSIFYPNYTIPFGKLNSAKRFEITVSPKLRSVTVLNTTMPIKYEDQFIHFDANAVTFNTTKHILLSSESNTSATQLSGKLNLEATDPLDIRPEDYAMELMSIEPGNQGNTERCSMLTDYSKLKEDATISWILNCSSPIQTERLFLCKIYAFIRESECYVPISSAIELSTHVIQNVTVASTVHNGELVVHADFIQTINITSLGYMAIVYSNHSDIHYEIVCRQYNQSTAAVNFSGLPGNSYRVSVFNIESDGLPFKNTASLPKNESIVGDNDLQQVPGETDKSLHIEYMHQPDNCCIRCVFFNNSIEFCLLVTINKSRVAIESDFGLLNINTSKVQNNTKECIHNCAEYVVQAFGYSSDFGMIVGSGVKISFTNEQNLLRPVSGSDEQQLPIASNTIIAAVVVSACAVIILSSFVVLVIILLIRKKSKLNLKVDLLQIALVKSHAHSGKDDTEELINDPESTTSCT